MLVHVRGENFVFVPLGYEGSFFGIYGGLVESHLASFFQKSSRVDNF